MRQRAAGLNRTCLALLGLLFVLAGALGLGIASGLLDQTGLPVALPEAQTPVVAGGWDANWVAPTVAVAGIVVAVLGLAWLIAQIPRRNQAETFRLHDVADTGQSWCEPHVLADAVAAHTASLAGVEHADAVLRGTPAHPDITITVTATDRIDLAGLVEQIASTVATGLSTSLDSPVARLGVQVEITRAATSTHKITV